MACMALHHPHPLHPHPNAHPPPPPYAPPLQFSVNQLNASQAGGSQNFFLHITRNGGGNWESPFTQYR